MKLPISLVIITLNEEKNIKRCIESVPFASEIIVVDSESRDQTVAIAKASKALVTIQKFLGYREQKQFAQNLATQEWILSLDADEKLSDKLQIEILEVFSQNKTAKWDGFKVPRLSYHLGRWIKHGGWYPDFQLRLFRKSKTNWVGEELHETVKVDGPVTKLSNPIEHFVFKDLEDQIDTNNEYSTRGAVALRKKGNHFSLLKLVFKPFGKFIECYFIKRGFLDGAPGFIIALGAAQSLFLKYAKLWEIQLDEKKN